MELASPQAAPSTARPLDLSPMLPAWARNQQTDVQADLPDAVSVSPYEVSTNFPMLPLPPAGASALALVASVLAAKTGLRVIRQTWRRWPEKAWTKNRLIRRQAAL